MKPEKLSDAIGMLDDDILEEAEKMRNAPANSKKSRRPLWIGLAATAACAVIIGGIALKTVSDDNTGIVDDPSSSSTASGDTDAAHPVEDDTDSGVYRVVDVKYPMMAKFPEFSDEYYDNGSYDSYQEQRDAWWSDRSAQRSMGRQSSEEIMEFFDSSAEIFLSESGDDNVVYSPVNVYVGMAMLSEITDGGTRKQLLDALGADSIDVLRQSANYAWNGCYSDDGMTASELANALWLSGNIPYKEEALQSLANNYYTSSHIGEMGSEDYNVALRDWVNLHTGNLLADSVSELGFEPATLLALTSTTYFKAQWEDYYRTEGGSFNAADGSTQQCEYLTYDDTYNYYWGDNFSAVRMPLEESGNMWIILPDEGIDAELLTTDIQVKKLLNEGAKYPDRTTVVVHMKVPMFDVSDDMSLIDGMKALGVTDVFDYTLADFTPLMENTEVYLPYVSEADHSTRVMIDEVGCTGASFVEIEVEVGAAPPPDEELYFIADRPFMFAVINECGIPLYCGIVNTME